MAAPKPSTPAWALLLLGSAAALVCVGETWSPLASGRSVNGLLLVAMGLTALSMGLSYRKARA